MDSLSECWSENCSTRRENGAEVQSIQVRTEASTVYIYTYSCRMLYAVLTEW